MKSKYFVSLYMIKLYIYIIKVLLSEFPICSPNKAVSLTCTKNRVIRSEKTQKLHYSTINYFYFTFLKILQYKNNIIINLPAFYHIKCIFIFRHYISHYFQFLFHRKIH